MLFTLLFQESMGSTLKKKIKLLSLCLKTKTKPLSQIKKRFANVITKIVKYISKLNGE